MLVHPNETIVPMKWNSDINLFRVIFRFTTTADAEIPLYDMTKYHGMFYNLLENTDPKLAFVLHDDKSPSMWSFSVFHLDAFAKCPDHQGYYAVPKGTSGMWFVNTTNQSVAKALAKNRALNFGKMEAIITTVEAEDHSFDLPPEHFETLTLRLHTPTAFYRNSEKNYYPLNERNILEWQLTKMEMMDIVKEFDADELRPYIRILRNDTESRGAHLTLPHNKNKIRVPGVVGYLTVKINGDAEMKEHLWNLLHIGQFIGMGSNSNVGFGHYSMVKTS